MNLTSIYLNKYNLNCFFDHSCFYYQAFGHIGPRHGYNVSNGLFETIYMRLHYARAILSARAQLIEKYIALQTCDYLVMKTL